MFLFLIPSKDLYEDCGDRHLACRAIRRSRRNRKTRYRQARFLNRTRSRGSLAPSLQHRVETTKAKGGTNRISNLCLSCEKCNQKKGTQDIGQFLAKNPEVLQRILSQAKRPLKDAAAVNSTRWALFN